MNVQNRILSVLLVLILLMLTACDPASTEIAESTTDITETTKPTEAERTTDDETSAEPSETTDDETSAESSETTSKPTVETTDLIPEEDLPQFDPTETLPPLAENEKSPIQVEENAKLFGSIIGTLSPNVLVIKVYNDECLIEQWGKYVYVITDQADDFSDPFFRRWRLQIDISSAERPTDPEQYVRIYAKKIQIDPSQVHAYKPIIYLYPESPTECSVKLTLNGVLTCTYPAYGEHGWNGFIAHPDGTLIFPDGKEYYALYWEGIQTAKWDFTQGFCVRGEDTAAFLEWALHAQGLTPREANEFIVYWLPLMQGNAYNVISFQTTAYTEGAALEIDPNPDSLLRVFMAYYPTDVPIEIQPQSFDGFIRSGFTVVEWGGSIITTP